MTARIVDAQNSGGGDVDVRVDPDDHGVHRRALRGHLSPGQVAAGVQRRSQPSRSARPTDLDRRRRLLDTDRRPIRSRLRAGAPVSQSVRLVARL